MFQLSNHFLKTVENECWVDTVATLRFYIDGHTVISESAISVDYSHGVWFVVKMLNTNDGWSRLWLLNENKF